MNTPSLFDIDTQRESYQLKQNEGVETDHDRMKAMYLKYGALSDREMFLLIGLPLNLISARRAEMNVVFSGEVHSYKGINSQGKEYTRTVKRWRLA